MIIARVTWLPALGQAISEREGELHVPVYLGDAMQWNLRQVGDTRDVVVLVPDDAPLHVPAGFAEDQARFDYGLQTLTTAYKKAHRRHRSNARCCGSRGLLRRTPRRWLILMAVYANFTRRGAMASGHLSCAT